MSKRPSPPETFAAFVELTGGTNVWAKAMGVSPSRISYLKSQGYGRRLGEILRMASEATGVPHRPEWSRDDPVAPAVAEWPWTPEANGEAA